MHASVPDPAAAADRLRALPPGDGAVRMLRTGAVAEVVLDHPRRRNAISVAMMLAFADAVEQLEASPPTAVLLHGAGGRAFCAGGDLRAVRAHLLDGSAAAAMTSLMTDTLDRLAGLPSLVFGAVDGPALGGGAEILTACHHITASAAARIGFVHARLGVSPGWGGARRLVARIGHRRAALVLAQAERMSASAARNWDLVDEVVDEGLALPRARARAEAVAALPSGSVRAALRVAKSPATEAEVFLGLWGGPAHRKALGPPR
ncbi:MAG: enoyl-CoA hydratase/isomerase family protein [Myxococcota bacterium]|nr:enoyl-CoA hydratase/isomerase family protein [Myxococcota bacterium]